MGGGAVSMACHGRVIGSLTVISQLIWVLLNYGGTLGYAINWC